jgi:mono/diheme cytochrome c family protein
MKSVVWKATLWVAVTVVSAAIVLGQGGARGQGGGDGQPGGANNASGAAIFQRSCGSCHAADVIANYRYNSAEEYRDIVNTMVAAGAQLTPQELPVLVDYLFATYGRKPQAAPGGTSPAAAAGSDPGKAILDTACVSCHGLEGLKDHIYDSREPYESLVRSMIAYGATVTDAQVPPLVDYLFKTYGKKPAAAAAAPAPANAAGAVAAAPDPGKAILDSACTLCHGLDSMANHVYASKEPYEMLVKSMIAYGASVTDAQIPPLVDYMFKTYRKK